ncbi:MAG: hypothetical protein EP322_04365 [Bacteroidetes bacterium]|nr:MAG: hypothetical protein EP322_04365 [Bacteroidota bacterium]
MKGLIITCLLGFSWLSNAQVLPIYYDTIPEGSELVLSGSGDYAASSIYKEISSKFLFGGNITDEMIDRSLDKHKVVNRIGVDVSGELVYRNFKPLIKKWNLGYQVTAGTYYFGGALYSKDLFNMVFNGNAAYKGDTADFSGSNISFTAFQKIGFGFVSSRNRSSVSFNVYNIQDRISLNVRNGFIAQSQEVDTIGLFMDGSLTQPLNNDFNQGIGFGVDFTYYMPIEWKNEGTAFVEFQLKNLGFGYMYQDQQVYTADTSFEFSGFRFDELFGDQAINFDTLDVLDSIGVTSGIRNTTFLLPGYLQVAKIIDEHSTAAVQTFFGVRLYPTLNYTPLIFAGVDWHAKEWLRVGASASYGGFARFRGGIYASAKWGRFKLGLGTENIIGAVSPKGNGLSANFRLSCEL